jgi:ubiquinone/menaquinone biosynthesis C-methylase UbiE
MSLFDVSETSYDNFMGRYSLPLGPKFADFAGIRSGMAVVDVGAGTGALTVELVRRGAEVVAAEPSQPFVAALQKRLPDIAVHAAPAEQLPWPDERFDAALAQLVVTFMEDAPAGVQEMRRVVREGGTVAVCMWDGRGMEMLAAVRRAQEALASGGPAPEARNLYRDRESLEGLFRDGFADVHSELLEVESAYTGFDEFWNAVDDGAGPAGAWLRSLDDAQRAAARDELDRQLGEPSGPFALTGRAWAVRATRA